MRCGIIAVCLRGSGLVVTIRRNSIIEEGGRPPPRGGVNGGTHEKCENILFVPPFTRKTVDRNEAFRAYAHEAFQTRTAI